MKFFINLSLIISRFLHFFLALLSLKLFLHLMFVCLCIFFLILCVIAYYVNSDFMKMPKLSPEDDQEASYEIMM